MGVGSLRMVYHPSRGYRRDNEAWNEKKRESADSARWGPSVENCRITRGCKSVRTSVTYGKRVTNERETISDDARRHGTTFVQFF